MEEESEDDNFTLTSFEPLSPEYEKSGFSRFIEGFTRKKLTSQSYGDIDQVHSQRDQNGIQNYSNEKNFGPKQGLREGSKRNVGWKATESKFGLRGNSKELPTKVVISSDRHTRTPSSVLKRLSLLISVERTAQQPSQSSSNLKKYWMPDEQCKVCYECGLKFHTFRRRHHCRLCGQIFCSRCCNEEFSSHQIGYTGVLRVCVYCKKIVLAYTSSSDVAKNLKQLKQDLSLVAQPDSSNSSATSDAWSSSFDDPELNRSFDVLGVSAEEANLLKQDSLKELWQQIIAPKTGLELQSHRIRLRTYSNCLVGRELVDWLVFHRKVPNRSQALQISQIFQDSGWIEPLINPKDTVFKDDFVLYVPCSSTTGDASFPAHHSPLADFVQPLPGNYPFVFDDSFLERKCNKPPRNKSAPNLSESDDKLLTGRKSSLRKRNSTSNLQNTKFVIQLQKKSLSCENLVVNVDVMKNEENKDETTESSSAITPPSAVLDHFVCVDDCYLPKSQASKQADNATGNDENGSEKNVDYVTKEKEMENAEKENKTTMKNAETESLDQLSSIHSRHISSFLAQLLDRVGLSQSWREVIEPLALKVSEMVVPDAVHNDDMDIRQYVKIKKIPGGEKSDCRIVSGVVCTKNVVHKKMAKSITEPQILMLACHVDFQRVENKLASLEPIVLQEEEFLKNYVGRIAALNPTIVLVEKTVSRLAQEMLLGRGVSVMLNVKPELMKRISRCTEGDVLPSLDQGSRPNLGTCRKFKIEKFAFKNDTTKTLAFFEGCPPKLGSTIVIRGGSMIELSKVKHILRFMIFVAYNSILEKAYIVAEFGTPFGIENGKDEEMGGREENHEEENIVGAIGGEGVLVGKGRKCLDDEPEATLKEEGMKFNEDRGKEKTHEEGKEGEVVKGSRDGKSVRDNLKLSLKKEKVLIEEGRKDKKSAEGIQVINQKSSIKNGNFNTDRSKSTVVNRESFEKVMGNVILSSSPLITYPVPYILTNEGQCCQLLTYMEEDLYWSPLFNDDVPSVDDSPEVDHPDSVKEPESKSIFMKETHPFTFAVLTKDARDLEARTLLAHFRADGGRIAVRRRQNDSRDEQKVEGRQNGGDDTDGIRKTKGGKETDRISFGKDCSNEPTGDELQNTSPLARDCFDPFLHQMIAILFSSYSTESANFPHSCISPWTVFMEFYAKNDIALGCFLERYCFRSSYVCPNPNCDVPMVKHVRYFAHGNSAVYINMKNLEAPIPGFSKTLLTWSWCRQCKQVTPLVPVSPEAWRLSFAKYLELRMYGSCYRRRTTVAPCVHSLHQDHCQYFAFNNIVASFKYLPVKIYEVFLPPTAITLLEEERQPQFWITHIQEMNVGVHQLVNSINERIAMVKTEPFLSNCITEIGHDKGQMQEKIKVLERKAMLLLHPPPSPGEQDDNKWLEPHEMSSLEYEILDGLTLLKRMMCEYGEKWNAQLLELVQLENEKKKSKPVDAKSHISTPASNQSPNDDSMHSNGSVSQSETKMSTSDGQDLIKSTQKSSQSPEATHTTTTKHAGVTLIESEQTSSSESEPKVDTSNETRGSSSSSDKKFQRHSELWATLSREVNSTRTDSQLPEDRPGSTLKRFKQMLPGVTFNPIRSPFPPHEHHMLPNSEVIPIVVNEKEPTSIIAYTLSTIDYQKKLHKIQDSMMNSESNKEAYTCVDMDVDGVCRLSTTSSNGIPPRSRTRSEVDTISTTSLLATLDDFVENYFECFDSDNEESNSKKDNKNISTDVESSGDKNNSSDIKDGQTTSTAVQGKELPSNISSSTQEEVEYHIRHAFSDSTAKFFCIVYFGEQFRRIRKTLFPGGEEKYIRSIQYCLEWQAKGGKSGSSFSKTKDDRFVIKEMSRSEAQSFLDIAPFYFEYIEKSIKQKKPTLLAKILGVYRIGCTSKLTNAPIRQHLLVMDNLLYNCKADKVFDLKGSIRSRYVMSSEQNNVLLDENLLETIAESPLFIRPHSKAVLLRAIHRDTEFLARHMVMDYSLLLGIEEDTSKLVVGIIDFIRTFTWDKKLEMYVKSTGILGGQGKMPTVVSPELYRERFCEAMQQYFLMIPNKWMGLGNELK